MAYVKYHFGDIATIVFDSYLAQTSIKDHEHRRRFSIKNVSPDVEVEEPRPLLFNQEASLSNDSNKNNFIISLYTTLHN